MRFQISSPSRGMQTAIDIPADSEPAVIMVERADRPDLVCVGIVLHPDGTIAVGHWPDGECWTALVRTQGVPDGAS